MNIASYTYLDKGGERFHHWHNNGKPHGECACVARLDGGEHALGCAARTPDSTDIYAIGIGPIKYVSKEEFELAIGDKK